MKNNAYYQMEVGDALWLKPERAEAYGQINRRVIFQGTKTIAGKAAPWILANGGSYKPSDFDKWESHRAF